MNPDVLAAGVFRFSSEVDDDAPPEAAGEEAPPRYSSISSDDDVFVLMSMAGGELGPGEAKRSRFFIGIERPVFDWVMQLLLLLLTLWLM